MKTGKSSKVASSQLAGHPGLPAILNKHFTTQWLQPLHQPSVEAFEQLGRFVETKSFRNKLIFDSGCGTGESTRLIAAQNPSCRVLGVDRSIHRLRKTGHSTFPCNEGNIIWLQAELETFWRLALDHGWKPVRNYLLYPNPHPKRSQLRRRWHAHPVFPALLSLGGCLEMRCNWSVYAQEFASAVGFATGVEVPVHSLVPAVPLSPFERKYAASGHPLYRVEVSPRLPPGKTGSIGLQARGLKSRTQ